MRSGTSPYSFAVRGEGVAKKPEGNIVELDVEGVPSDVTVSLQIGPAINGTALRDASGLYRLQRLPQPGRLRGRGHRAEHRGQDAACSKDLDRDALEGKTVKFLGAFTLARADRDHDHAGAARGGRVSRAS